WRWSTLGIPFTGDPDAAQVKLLTGGAAEGLSEVELYDLLAGGLLIDEGALRQIWERGLGEWTGVRPLDRVDACFERYEAHALNAGESGDGRSPVWWGGWPVEVVADEVEVLSRLIRFDEQRDFGPSATVYRNERGGRIVHLGLDPWYYIGIASKVGQIKRLVNWASGGTFPMEIIDPVPVAPILRRTADGGRFVLLLQNSSLDEVARFRVRIRFAGTGVETIDGHGIAYRRTSENEIEFEVGPIPGWGQHIVLGRN
ncbi:MAG: hypothetical protein ACOC4K_01990, partial [Verrucomicrobiota bacterium]